MGVCVDGGSNNFLHCVDSNEDPVLSIMFNSNSSLKSSAIFLIMLYTSSIMYCKDKLWLIPYKNFFSFYSAFHPCINYEHFPFLYTNSQFRDFSANRSYSRNFYRAITKYLYTIHNIVKSGLFISIISVKTLIFIQRHSDPYRMQNGIVSNSDIKCIYIFWKIIAIKKHANCLYVC